MLSRALVLGLCASLGALIAVAMLQLPEASGELAQAGFHLDASGVRHPVTAVLLNFRGYDTFLEVAVVLSALFGVLAARGEEHSTGPAGGSPQPMLQAMARMLVPLMVLVSGYLLWAGAHRPGGAFQAGAVLAASGVLLFLAGLMPAWQLPGALLRAGLAGGLLIFAGVAALLLLTQGALLQYPPAQAGPLILLIEAALTLSLGLVLAGLFLWLPREHEEAGP